MRYVDGVDVHNRSELQMLPLLIDVRTASAIANVSDRYIRELCEKGVVRAKRLGKAWRIDRDNFLEYLGLNE